METSHGFCIYLFLPCPCIQGANLGHVSWCQLATSFFPSYDADISYWHRFYSFRSLTGGDTARSKMRCGWWPMPWQPKAAAWPQENHYTCQLKDHLHKHPDNPPAPQLPQSPPPFNSSGVDWLLGFPWQREGSITFSFIKEIKKQQGRRGQHLNCLCLKFC